MSGISAIYFLDRKGKPIIFRNYRGEVDQDVSESFQKQVLELEETNMKPTFTIENVHYCWTKHQNIYSNIFPFNILVVSVSKRNINLALIFSFLYKLEEILIDYFKVLEEETIRDNFVLIYELLDEIIDHGYPQTTETTILKEYIKTESNKKADSKKDLELSKTLTNAISWRKEGIFYKKNEAYLDVIEKVDCLIAQDGNVLHSQVLGSIKMKSFLTGMPNVILGLNDKVLFESKGKSGFNNNNKTIEMDDLKFHQCVNINKFESERAIEFTPPDGEFELMSYRLNMQLKPLIWVEVKIEHPSSNKYEYNVKAKSNFKNKSMANNVDIFVPVPNDLQNATFRTASGTVVYLSDREDILWNIKSFEGLAELSMKCTFNVPTVRIDDPNKHLKRPISLSYEIPYFTVSGIQVRFLKIVEKSGYEAIPWVRYITQNGEYNIRII